MCFWFWMWNHKGFITLCCSLKHNYLKPNFPCFQRSWPGSSCPCQSIWAWMVGCRHVFSSLAAAFCLDFSSWKQTHTHQKAWIFSVGAGTHTCTSSIPPQEFWLELRPSEPTPGFVMKPHKAAELYSQICRFVSLRESVWSEKPRKGGEREEKQAPGYFSK